MKEIFRKQSAEPPEPMRQVYTMTPAEFEVLKKASNPGRIVQINAPSPLTAEERAAIFWNRMSDKYRFHVATVAPHTAGHPGQFTAVPLPELAAQPQEPPKESDGAVIH